MNTEMKNAVIAVDDKAQYDEKAKSLLGNKIILAHLLVNTVSEFMGMEPGEVVKYIEGDPLISKVPLEPGLTNILKVQGDRKVIGMNTENVEINEGLVRFDIIFYVRMKDGLSQIIVNVEAQKDEPSAYDILNRAVFYVSRLVSSQKGRDFTNTKYNDIKRFFSIWICMNMEADSMNYVHLTNDTLLGVQKWKGNLNLLNIVLVGLAKEQTQGGERHELHRLLGTLLSMELPVEKKLSIMENEYGIPAEDGIRRDLETMCNLSQGIEDSANEKVNTKVIMNMYRRGYPIEQIAEIVEKSLEEVKAVIKKEEPVLV